MGFVSIIVDLICSLVTLDLFVIFVSAFACVSLMSLAIHFVSGKRLIYL